MFSLTKSFTFEASHQLEHHDGKCAHLHGHSYSLVVELSCEDLQPSGPEKNMAVDFGRISAVVKKLVHSHLDHRHLNDSLQTDSPTAEYIAYWCFTALKPKLPLLSAVTIRETATSSATFRPHLHPQLRPSPPTPPTPPTRHFYCPHCPHCATSKPAPTGSCNGSANGTANGSANGTANGSHHPHPPDNLHHPHQNETSR